MLDPDVQHDPPARSIRKSRTGYTAIPVAFCLMLCGGVTQDSFGKGVGSPQDSSTSPPSGAPATEIGEKVSPSDNADDDNADDEAESNSSQAAEPVSESLSASDSASRVDVDDPASVPVAEPIPGEVEITKEVYEEELETRLNKFRASRDRLALAVGDLKEIHIRYLNDEDRSRSAKDAYFEKRQIVRDLLDETYMDGLDVLRWGVDEEVATYLVTMVGHRLERDIYDAPTMEGAARLIDGGSRLTFLFQAAARSSVVEGEFERAKRLFEVIDQDQRDEIDNVLEFNLDKYEASFEREQQIREKEAAEDRLPRVVFHTSQGDFVVELFLDQAPSTVANFIQLVENKFYDGLDFFQVIDHMLALTGDPSGVGNGSSGKFLVDEHSRFDARDAFRGSLVMAKVPEGETGNFYPNSASSQFAILFLPMSAVSEQQTIFGRVIEGMDVVSRLRRVDPNKKKEKGELVYPPDMILTAEVIRRPDELPEPQYAHIHEH